MQQHESHQREGDGRHVGHRHVRVGDVQRRDGEEQRREQTRRTAERIPSQAVQEVHGAGPHGHREQPPEEEVRTGIHDERRACQQVAVAEQPPDRCGQHVEGARQIEVQGRIEEEPRVGMAVGGRERLGDHRALVDVDEAVRQPPGDALET